MAERSLQSIKDKWQALKKNVKEKVAASTRRHRKEREKTGGGENPTLDDPDVIDCLNDDEKEILQVIPSEQITGKHCKGKFYLISKMMSSALSIKGGDM